LETPPNRGVELPGDIGCAQDQNALGVFADTVHLYKQFGFDTSGRLGFSFATRDAQSVDLVNEDDGRLVFTCHIEKLLNQSLVD
jgi:hypothetical protein